MAWLEQIVSCHRYAYSQLLISKSPIMNLKKLNALALFLLAATYLWSQDISTNLGDPASGWPGGDASNVSNTITGCEGAATNITLDIPTKNEEFEIPSGNTVYRIGGSNTPSSQTQITVVITFNPPVMDPVLCLQDLDINGQGAETITNITPAASGVTGGLTLTGPHDVDPTGDNSDGCIQWPGTLSEVSFTYVRPNTNGWGLFLDSIGFGCPIVVDTDCCDDLVPLNDNDDFEAGNTGFQSDYDYNSSTNLLPGEYSIVNGAEASQICENWKVQDPGTCDNTGNFMVVNGKTNQRFDLGPAPATIWSNEFTGFDEENAYQFCARFKDLSACCFNVAPKLTIQVGTVSQTVSIQTSSDPCDWQEVSIPVLATDLESGTVEIIIQLLQNGYGDGNDLAIDDIKLGALIDDNIPELPVSATLVTVEPSASSIPDFVNYTLTAAELPYEDCVFSWTVCQTDEVTHECIETTIVSNPVQWQSLSTSFEGYNGTNQLSGNGPGEFDSDLDYKYTYNISCPCILPASLEADLNYSAPLPISNEGDNTGVTSKLLPNPTTGIVTLNLNLDNFKEAKQLTYFLTNVNGVLLKQAQYQLEAGQSDISKEIDLSTYPPGVYFIQGKVDGKIILSEKLIKQ